MPQADLVNIIALRGVSPAAIERVGEHLARVETSLAAYGLATGEGIRPAITTLVSNLIDMLDDLDGDPDLEPYLAGINSGSDDDREVDDDGEETALETHGKGFKASGGDDIEDGHDAELDPAEAGIGDAEGMAEQVNGEPSLGWTGDMNQNVALADRQAIDAWQRGMWPASDGEEETRVSLRPRQSDATPNVRISHRVVGRPTVEIVGRAE